MDVKSYSKLLLSVGQQGLGAGRKRPLSPVQCAEYIKRLIEEEGESLDKIAKRLNLGKPVDSYNMYKKRDTSQITSFLNLLKVSPKSRDLAGWSTDEHPYIPFSTISELHTLIPDQQDIILQTINKSKNKRRALGKEDVKKIKKWLKENPNLSIEECVEKVLQLKPVTVTTYMIVVEINDRLRQFISENVDYEDKLLNILEDGLAGKFYGANAGKLVMAISMDKEAHKIFHEYQYKRGSSYAQFLNKFLETKLE